MSLSRFCRSGFLTAALLVGAWSFSEAALSAQQPKVTAIVHAASYRAGPIAPGEMVTVFGSNIGPASLVGLLVDVSGRVANQLAGTRILFDGTPAPLIYVSSGLSSAIVPYGVRQPSTQLQVEYNGVRSAPLPLSVAASAPGIFTANSSGSGQGAILNQDGSINTTSNPAQADSVVSLFASGEGQTDPPGVDGELADDVLPKPTSRVSVRIGGLEAEVVYAGTAPGSLKGFLQVNARIPIGVVSGNAVPITLTIGDATSQPGVTLAVTGGTATLPEAPANLKATPVSPTQINLTWDPSPPDVQQISIERKDGGSGSYAAIATVPASQTAYQDNRLTPATVYAYRIRAEAAAGVSPYSTEATATTAGVPPLVPTNLRATSASATEISLTWVNTSAVGTVRVERKTGPAIQFQEIGTVTAPAATYRDQGLTPSTTYGYRIRVKTTAGLSPYSNESSATTMPAPLPPAPALQAAAVSSSQIRLSWTTTATGIVRFRVERRTGTGSYSEISQPGPASAMFDDTGLNASTTYSYRMRVETSGGLSPYSNEVSTTTAAPPPTPPTNLRVTATSQVEVRLTWTNTATNATAIHVEQKTGSGAFQDIGTYAASVAVGRIPGLSASTPYTFRLRAEGSTGMMSPYSNEAAATTPPKATIFLIHGIGQGGDKMLSLRDKLGNASSPDKVDLARFQVDAGFDWSECADNPDCGANCTIQNGAAQLASYIASKPQGDLVLVGYSMGGLLARELLLSYPSLFSSRRLAALITLGSPNVGYPYDTSDDYPSSPLRRCSTLVRQMASDWRTYQSTNQVDQSSYLTSLNTLWGSAQLPGGQLKWLALSGTFCSDPIRDVPLFSSQGCPDRYPYSDGIVCQVSSTFWLGVPRNGTTGALNYDTFQHADKTTLCSVKSLFNYNVLFKPPMGSSVLTDVRSFINGL